MKSKIIITTIFLITICLLTACENENNYSVVEDITTQPTKSTSEITSSGTTTNTTTTEMTTTTTPVTEMKSETELKLIELSEKQFNDYTSEDFKFLLNTDRTSYIKAFDLILNNGDGGNGSDGWYRFPWSSVSSYILIHVPLDQITIDIMPPANFSSEEYLKSTTIKPYMLSIYLNLNDVMFGEIKSGMTKEQVNEILEGSEIVCFTWEYSLHEGYFVKYEYDGLLYEFCFPDTSKYKLVEVEISEVYDPTGVEIKWDPTKPRNGQWDMGQRIS